MSLPFLKPRNLAPIIIAKGHAEGSPMDFSHEMGSHPEGYMKAIEELMKALHGDDAERAADAFKAAFQLCEVEPHEEIEHEENP